MNLNYSETGVVKFSIIKYLQKQLDKFTEDLRRLLITPASEHLLQVRGEDDAKSLYEDQAEMFHHSVEKFLFMISQSRSYIQMKV